ncbi:MAG: ethanolamine ammonia-lyase subunit EutC [Polyangiaceae bacterium]
MTLLSRDPWFNLARSTNARIALGRSGGSLRTSSQLELRLAHARARDAVQASFDAATVVEQLRESGVESELVGTRANSRQEYLMNPELGRSLSDGSRCHLAKIRDVRGPCELVIVVSDGLSPLAAQRQALPTLRALLPHLAQRAPSLAPVLVAPLARVKLGDEIGAALGAKVSLVLVGERPGLSSPDSLGAYITYGPCVARTDADRNCISNIRAEGLPPEEAAARIACVIAASRRQQLSGVNLELEGQTTPTVGQIP